MKKIRKIFIIGILLVISITATLILFNKDEKEFTYSSNISTEKLNEDLKNNRITKAQYVKEYTYLLYESDKLDSKYKGEVPQDALLFSSYLSYIEENWDSLSKETKKEIAPFLLGSYNSSNQQKVNSNEILNSVNKMSNVTKLDSDEQSNIIPYNKAKLSKTSKFIIFYNSNNKNNVTEEIVDYILNTFEESVEKMLDYYDVEWNYFSADVLFDQFTNNNSKVKKEFIKLLKENNIDEDLIDKAFPIVITDELPAAALGAYGGTNLFASILMELLQILGTEYPAYYPPNIPGFLISEKALNISFDVTSNEEIQKEYIEKKITLYGDINFIVLHEMFHHFQYQIFNKNYLTKPPLFASEMTANYNAAKLIDSIKITNDVIKILESEKYIDIKLLNSYKNMDFLNKIVSTGHSKAYSLASQQSLDEAYIHLTGYQAYIFADKYSRLVQNGEKYLIDTFKNNKDLKYLSDKSNGKYDDVMRELAKSIIVQDYDKNLYKTTTLPLQRRNLCTDYCVFSDKVDYSAMHYYYLDAEDYKKNQRITISTSSNDLELVVLAKTDLEENEYKLLMSTDISKTISFIPYDYLNVVEQYLGKEKNIRYNNIIIAVVNSSYSNDVEYTISVIKNSTTSVTQYDKVLIVGNTMLAEPSSKNYSYSSSNTKVLEKVKINAISAFFKKLVGKSAENKFKAKSEGISKVTINSGTGKATQTVKVFSKDNYIQFKNIPDAIPVGETGTLKVDTKDSILDLLSRKYDSISTSNSNILSVSANQADYVNHRFDYVAKSKGLVTITARKNSGSVSKEIIVYEPIDLSEYISIKTPVRINQVKAICIDSNSYKIVSSDSNSLEVIKAVYDMNKQKITTVEGVEYDNSILTGTCNYNNIFVVRGKKAKRPIVLSLYLDDYKISTAEANVTGSNIKIAKLEEPNLKVGEVDYILFKIQGMNYVNDEPNYTVKCSTASNIISVQKNSYDHTSDSNKNGIINKNNVGYGYCKIKGLSEGEDYLYIAIYNKNDQLVASNYDEKNDDTSKEKYTIVVSENYYEYTSGLVNNVGYDMLEGACFKENNEVVFGHNELQYKNLLFAPTLEDRLKQENLFEFRKYLPKFKNYKKHGYNYIELLGTRINDVELKTYCENNLYETSDWSYNEQYITNSTSSILNDPRIIWYRYLNSSTFEKCGLKNQYILDYYDMAAEKEILNNLDCNSNLLKYYNDFLRVYNEKNGLIKTRTFGFASNWLFKEEQLVSNEDLSFVYTKIDKGYSDEGRNYAYINVDAKYDNKIIPYLSMLSADSFVKTLTDTSLSEKYYSSLIKLNNSMKLNGQYCLKEANINNKNDIDVSESEMSDLLANLYSYYHLKKNGLAVDFVYEDACNYSKVETLWKEIEKYYITEYVEK